MTNRPHRMARLLLLVTAALLSLPSTSFANGPLVVCQPGQPYLWPNGGTNIPFNPDQGDLGPVSHAQAVALVASAFQVWGDVPSATTTYLQGPDLPVDVNITNFLPYLQPAAPDGLSAIVFDHTGQIFTALFGANSGILGFAGPEWVAPASCTIAEGVSFLNGPSFANAVVALDVLVHEFGHYQNLAHTVVNGQILAFGDHSGPSPNNTFGAAALTHVETMYPFYFGAASGTSSLHRDDIASLSTLYPEPTFAATTGRIQGVIFASNGTTRLTGVNVIARNVANPFADAVSAISSDFTDSFVQTSEFTGRYTLRGLTPGANYAIYVDQILAGGFSTPPAPLPYLEEFYNGPGESNGDPNPDPPNERVDLAAVAGSTLTGIDIIFNAPKPGEALPVGDDGAVELALPFQFRLCDVEFSTVWVNANGNLTFGGPDPAFVETRFGFLNGRPRIAGLWDDLDLRFRGQVTFAMTDDTLTVSWIEVPERTATPAGLGSNTFAITLHGEDDFAEITYGSVSAVDGLAGVSCGGRSTSRFEQQTDLSARAVVELFNAPAGFEIFSPGKPFDLDDRTVRFTTTVDYADSWAGSNNSVATASWIKLPFNSSRAFQLTELEQPGDMDFFRFHAKAGDILAVETLTGQIDSFIGIFDPAGKLLASNDDGGAGILSRLIVQIPVEADYIVGVTAWPDIQFQGIGTETGRYVLHIRTYQGTLIAAGNDTSAATALGFDFSFYGATWSSVFVNSNGNLTFGAGNTDFTETVAEFLSGPARIAALWDDLNATTGLVLASPAHNSMTIHYISVPEFGTDSPNYFSVRMEANGRVTLSYEGVLSQDSIVGITAGGGVADPGLTDLSSASSHSRKGTTYEQFTAGFSAALPLLNPFDLPFLNIRFQ